MLMDLKAEVLLELSNMDSYRASLKPALSVRNFASFCAIDFSNGLNLGIKN
jgi:hypothetical protein